MGNIYQLITDGYAKRHKNRSFEHTNRSVKMKVVSAEFLISNSDYKKCPELNKPEYAFIGRSNVGKSSLINLLTGRKGLAKTSGTPGKTQLINHFVINDDWYIIDLPGYGYAKVSKSERKKFKGMIYHFLESHTTLMCVFVLLDSRISPQAVDLQFMNWLGEKGIPFVMCFTKIENLKKAELEKNLETYKAEMLKTWEALPPIFTTSSRSGEGKAEILQFIEETNTLYESDF